MTKAVLSEIRTTSRPKCLLCNLPGTLLYEGLVDSMFKAPGKWSLKRCSGEGCGLVWLDPAPIESDLYIAYQTYYTHDTGGQHGLVPQVRQVLYLCYRALKFIPSALVGLHKSQTRKKFRTLEKLPPGSLLDVGCGDGGFLNLMQSRGWTVDGVDFDEQAIASAKSKFDLNLRLGDLFSAKFSDNTFDAVTLSHVIEHVPDPVGLLAEIRRILKPGGRVALTTPNINSLGHQEFGKYWRGLEPPRHLNIFSLAALRECAERAGLEKIEAVSIAADADIIVGASHSIRHFYEQPVPGTTRPQINIFRAIGSLVFQYREFFSLRSNPEAGEEAVLVCQKRQT